MAIQPADELIRAIRKYKNGERKAFGEIYRLSKPYLGKCAANVVNRMAPGATGEILEDVLQESFMTIAEKLPTLQREEAYFQWAGQIVTNHALRIWKKESRTWDMERLDEDGEYEQPDERFIPEDILQNREKQQLIRSMLQQLPAGQYMCLVEYFYNGLKEREIAEKLEMPLGTVKTNLSRAKKKLKDIVETHQKKNGVKLYSMSWLLLVLFWDEIKAAAASTAAKGAAILVVEETPKVFAAAAGASAATAGGTSAAAAGGASAAAGTAGGLAGMSIGTKILAGVVAAALAVGLGATAGLVIPEKASDRAFSVNTGAADWDRLPVVSPANIAAIENAFGDLEPGRAAKGKIIEVEKLPDDHAETADGVLCNVEYVNPEELVLSGENADGKRMEVLVQWDADTWTIEGVKESRWAERLYPINEAMRQKGIPAVFYSEEITDWEGLSVDGSYCFAIAYWRGQLGHTDFDISHQLEDDGWYSLYLTEPDYYEKLQNGEQGDRWELLCINKETLEIRREEQPPETVHVPTESEPTVPESTQPDPTEPASVPNSYGDVVLTAEELDYINKLVRNVYLPVPATGPAVSYEQGKTLVQADQFITGCAGVNGLLRGTKTPEGLVVSKTDVTQFLLDTLGWEAPYNTDKYSGILDNGNGTYLLPVYGGDKTDIGIIDLCAVTADRILVYVPRDYTSYHCVFQRNEESPYGWTLTAIKDNETPAQMYSVMAMGLFEHGVVVPAEGGTLEDGASGCGELTMEAAQAYVRHYVTKTTGKRPSKVTVEDWGLVANSYYTYKVTVEDTGKIYLIGTSDAALAEYHGENVARTWFDWELTE